MALTAKNDESPIWVQKFVVVLLGLAFFWELLLKPSVLWIRGHILLTFLVFTTVLAIGVTGFYYYTKYEDAENMKRKKQKEEENLKKTVFEEKQKVKGLNKFMDCTGNEKWGTPAEVETWKAEERKRTLVYKITEAIERFAPVRKHKKEYSYQVELAGWLRAQFPSTKIEEKRGSVRPDIIVEDIAIEIKGPTGSTELATISDKCMRYPNHYKNLILVLFDVTASDSRYNDWFIGLQRTFPNAKVIRKD